MAVAALLSLVARRALRPAARQPRAARGPARADQGDAVPAVTGVEVTPSGPIVATQSRDVVSSASVRDLLQALAPRRDRRGAQRLGRHPVRPGDGVGHERDDLDVLVAPRLTDRQQVRPSTAARAPGRPRRRTSCAAWRGRAARPCRRACRRRGRRRSRRRPRAASGEPPVLLDRRRPRGPTSARGRRRRRRRRSTANVRPGRVRRDQSASSVTAAASRKPGMVTGQEPPHRPDLVGRDVHDPQVEQRRCDDDPEHEREPRVASGDDPVQRRSPGRRRRGPPWASRSTRRATTGRTRRSCGSGRSPCRRSPAAWRRAGSTRCARGRGG